MANLIDKDTLVAKIKKYYEEYLKRAKIDVYDANYWIGKADAYRYMLEIIDTLEVKEVDLEKHLKEDIEDVLFDLDGVAIKGATHYITVEDVKDIAKHFFELGMCSANPLTVKDIKKIYHLVNEVSDDLGVRAMYVNIYQEALKRFKAQKGE